MFLIGIFLLGCVAASPQTCQKPNNFPSSLTLEQKDFENWSKEIKVGGLFETTPKSPADIVELANWARQNNYRLRPSAKKLTWSPNTVLFSQSASENNKCKSIILVNTSSLTSMRLGERNPSNNVSSVIVEPGATFEALLELLGKNGLGIDSHSSLGDATIGGMIAVASHGTGVPHQGDTTLPGKSYTSLSNLILELKAVIWNPASSSYEIQSIKRDDARMAPLLSNLGRILVTEVTLRVGQDERYRCLSLTNVTITQLMAPPGGPYRETLSYYLDTSGFVGMIHFPFTPRPWLRLWYKSPTKPPTSRETTQAYNYKFLEIPAYISEFFFNVLLAQNLLLTPAINQGSMTAIDVGLTTDRARDLWGWSRHVKLNVRDSAPKVHVTSFAFLTARSSVQRVAHELYKAYDDLVRSFAFSLKFPMNGPIEVRVTPVESAGDIGVAGAESPTFSPAAPLLDRPEFDTVIWLDVTTSSRTQYVPEFYNRLQDIYFRKFDGQYALVRPDWSKKFGYSKNSIVPWTNSTFIKNIPSKFSNWDKSANLLRSMDPDGVFLNDLFQPILP